MKTSELKELARKAIAGNEAAERAMVFALQMGHTRSSACSMLYRQRNGRGVRQFWTAVKSWAENE